MTLGVFGGFMALQFEEPPRWEHGVEGHVGCRAGAHRWSALGLSICLLSLAGIPPLAGLGKVPAIRVIHGRRRTRESSSFIALAVIGMLRQAAVHTTT